MEIKSLSARALGTALLYLSAAAFAQIPTSGERASCRSWLDRQFKTVRGVPPGQPFSFIYDGRPSRDLLPGWPVEETTRQVDAFRTQCTKVYRDPKTGLEMRLVMVRYDDFPTLEWTLYFRNAGTADTPLLEQIQAIDATFERSDPGEFKLHHFTGSLALENDFQPLETVMEAGAVKKLSGTKGRPTNDALCYFNLEWPDHRGIIIALGWPGQWAGEFIRDSGRGLRVTCGQELTRLRLHPGEEIRTPLVVLQFWEGGDWIRAQNIWRRFMVAHNMPQPGGRPVRPQYGGCFGNIRCSAAEEIAQMDGLLKDGVSLDHWIIDAGWYPMEETKWWVVGTWEVDPERFPKGLREVGDHCHDKGIEFIVWFEPERVSFGSRLDKEHPDWILRGPKEGLLNLGNPEARTYITDLIDGMLTQGGIDHFRSDYNINPLDYWRANDAEDRKGITENFYVQGFLAFWDELLRRHPNMYIDTCASGGRRNDLETLRRSVPLLRSDYPLGPLDRTVAVGQQAQTFGISFWIPYHGTGGACTEPYALRSAYSPAYRIGYNALDPKRNVELLLRTVDEMRRIFPYILKDFYPLTPYSLDKKDWIAWQYHYPDQNGGVVQAFRRDESAEAEIRLKLRGLDLQAEYLVTDSDENAPRRIAGRQLSDEGLAVRIAAQPGSAVIFYRKAG